MRRMPPLRPNVAAPERRSIIMNIFLIALIGALVVVAIMLIGRFTLGRHIPVEWPKIARWAGLTFVLNYLFALLILYFAQPALTGPYGGWQWALWLLFVTALISLSSIFRVAVHRVNTAGQQPITIRRNVMGRPRVVDAGSPADAADHNRGKVRAGIVGVGVLILMLLIVNPVWAISTTWFDGNAKALAHIPNVEAQTSDA